MKVKDHHSGAIPSDLIQLQYKSTNVTPNILEVPDRAASICRGGPRNGSFWRREMRTDGCLGVATPCDRQGFISLRKSFLPKDRATDTCSAVREPQDVEA